MNQNQARAITKFIRVPPRKARLAADLIRGKGVEEAKVQLDYCNMKAGRLLRKTLDSAIANAEIQFDANREGLMVREVRVDEGPSYKRAKSRSRGSKSPILKRTSHFLIVVEERAEEKGE